MLVCPAGLVRQGVPLHCTKRATEGHHLCLSRLLSASCTMGVHLISLPPMRRSDLSQTQMIYLTSGLQVSVRMCFLASRQCKQVMLKCSFACRAARGIAHRGDSCAEEVRSRHCGAAFVRGYLHVLAEDMAPRGKHRNSRGTRHLQLLEYGHVTGGCHSPSRQPGNQLAAISLCILRAACPESFAQYRVLQVQSRDRV
jgi:hypothetical protein